jgi:hypothetical protein
MVEGTGTVSDEDESVSSDDDIQISLKDKAATRLPIRIRNMKMTAGAGAGAGGVKAKAWTDNEVHKFVSTLRINVDTQFMSSHKKQSLNGVSSADLAYSLMRTNEDLSKEDVIKRAHAIVSSTFGFKLKKSTHCSSCGHIASSSTNEN